MESSSVTAQTVSGLKRLARSISREKNITLVAAMNVAAKQSGFQNYQHFLNRQPALTHGVEIEITSTWSTRRSPNQHGRLTAKFTLSKPLNELMTAYGFSICKRVAWYKMHDPLTLVPNGWIDSRDTAARFLGKAVRTLQFIDATGLKPCKVRASDDIMYYRGQLREPFPGSDHATSWKEPKTNRLLFLNEPYPGPEDLDRNRRAWAVQNGYAIQRLEWGSLYWLGNTVCDLISHKEKGADIGNIARSMRAAPPPFDEQKYVFDEFVSDRG